MIASLGRTSVLLACLLGSPTLAQAPAETLVEVLDWGITDGSREPIPAAPEPDEQGLAPAREMQDIRHLVRTDTVEARLCRSFGMTVKVDETAPRRLQVRVAHPKFTRPDGATSVEDRFSTRVVDGTSYVGFTFDHEWEMEPGAWSIVLFARGREVARRDFTVTRPAGPPRSECQRVTS